MRSTQSVRGYLNSGSSFENRFWVETSSCSAKINLLDYNKAHILYVLFVNYTTNTCIIIATVLIVKFVLQYCFTMILLRGGKLCKTYFCISFFLFTWHDTAHSSLCCATNILVIDDVNNSVSLVDHSTAALTAVIRHRGIPHEQT